MASFVVLAWGAVIFNYYQKPAPPIGQLAQYGTGNHNFFAVANFPNWTSLKDRRAMLITRTMFADVDRPTDKFIAKSVLYSIEGPALNLATLANEKTMRFAVGVANMIEFNLVVFPPPLRASRSKHWATSSATAAKSFRLQPKAGRSALPLKDQSSIKETFAQCTRVLLLDVPTTQGVPHDNSPRLERDQKEVVEVGSNRAAISSTKSVDIETIIRKDASPFRLNSQFVEQSVGSPTITANRSDEEPERLTRLDRVFAGLRNKIRTDILALHDHKGCMYVNWAKLPSTSDLAAAIAAWGLENEPMSNHAVKGRPLVWDVGGDNPFGGPDFYR